ADALSMICIDDGDIDIKSASAYAGKTSSDTERAVKEDLGDIETRVAVIGPAGENLVKFACINTEWSRNAGRTGMGAIFGSKNLKAVAVRGSHDLPVHDMDALINAGDRAFDYLKSHDLFELWQQQGLMSVIDYINTAGAMPTHNFNDAHFDGADTINGDTMLKYKIGDTACFCCPMSCGNICLVKEGKYAGTVTEGPEYETACMFGSNVGVTDFTAILRANMLCDDLGIDTISTGNLIAVLIDGYEQGILNRDDLDGMTLKWGDGDSVHELIEKIAYRKGIGNIVADGTYGLIKHFPDLKNLISHTKGLEMTAYDARIGVTMALGYGTSDIGAHHTRAWPLAKEIELGSNWTLDERVDLVIYHQTVRPLFDCLGVCRLPWIELGLDEHIYAELFAAATGVPLTLEDMFERSSHIYDLTRTINVKLGVGRKDDYPSERAFTTPIKTGPHAGELLDREYFESALTLYYKKRGWDENGVPTTFTA
ncbi:MAG: hypothetical protein GQ566_01865, partial [Methanosarcinales archaeon]|nr:hypothetical protein [Methanosarcinales archaeon]